MATATVARIRRCVRDSEYAVAQNLVILAARPDAKPTADDEFTIDSFFDLTAHAQSMLNEKFAVISSDRRNEAAECDVPLGIGSDIPVAPVLPNVRMIDSSRALDRVMLIKGLAVDRQADRNSIEAVG
jgi:hypothetical protein